MISFKKLLGQETEDITSWLVRVVVLLLEATALHAIEHDPDECAAFRQEIRETIEKFERTTDSRDTLILAGAAVKSLQTYNRSVERFIASLSSEKQAVISLMSESLLKAAHAGEPAAQNLRRIERELAAASRLPDIRALKGRLGDCLDTICQEVARREEQASDSKASESDPAKMLGPHDQVTGLPAWQHAQARIRDLSGKGTPCYVLVLFLRNLDIVNRRVGFAAGDQILTLFGQRVAQFLSGTDQLFRWRGPCFVAVLERSESHDHVMAEAAKISSFSMEKEIQSQGRSLFFKTSMAWTLIQIHDGLQASEISRKIDAFAAEQHKPKAAALDTRLS